MTRLVKDVGIIAMELIFPAQYVEQKELEKYDKVAEGKYTLGLGQSKMAFCTDREDINSLCLTVVSKIMKNYNLDYSNIGFLQVGTETILDKSKSVKSVLMQLFESSGNLDVEGVDTTNACYGGTAALFNAIAWVESSAWDGRFALVVAADIAVYAQGPARPTGGAGAVAMLIGPNAPLILESRCRATYMRHAYDFYKPDLTSLYPIVDGKLSIECYLSALDQCYKLLCKKASLLNLNGNQPFSINSLDAMLFHSPYCKLVQKSFARLVFNDFLMTPKEQQSTKYPGLEKFADIKLEQSYFDRDLEKAFMTFSNELFLKKTKPSLLIGNQVGNMYTPSLYGCLVSLLISKPVHELAGNKIGLFSYGSGLASTMYVLQVSSDSSPNSSLCKMITHLLNIKSLLNERHEVAPNHFSEIMKENENNNLQVPFKPSTSLDKFFPGTWYLAKIDEKFRRTYEQIPF